MEVELPKGQHATWAMSFAGEFFDCPNGFHSGFHSPEKGYFSIFSFFWLFLKRNVQGKVRREVERPKATLRPRPSGWTTARSWKSTPLIRIRVSIQRCLRDGKIPGEPHGDFCFFHDDGEVLQKIWEKIENLGHPKF